MKRNPILHFLSLLVLLGIIISPLVPASVASASTLAAPQSPPDMPAAKPNAAYLDNCQMDGTTTGPFLICVSDGSLPGLPPLQALRGGTGQPINEGPSSPANPSQLVVFPGDTLRVHFSVTYTHRDRCNDSAATTLNGLRLLTNPLGVNNPGIIGPTFLHKSGQPTMTFQDGQVNIDATSDAVDTIFGYFDIPLIPSDFVQDTTSVVKGFFVNFQITSQNSSGCNSRAKIDVTGPDALGGQFTNLPWRRPRQGGFSVQYITAAAPQPELSTTKLSFRIANIVANTNFTYSASVTPSGTGINPVINALGTTNPCPPSGVTGGTFDCDINNIGPLPESLDAITVTLSVVGTSGSDSLTQTISATIPILHPGLTITKKDSSNGTQIYPPDSTVTYEVAVTNTGGVPLSKFRVLDSLGGDLTNLFVAAGTTNKCFDDPGKLLLPGAACVVTYQYTIKRTDTNPLPNTADVNAVFDPDVGNDKPVTATTSFSVPVEAPDLELKFDGDPTPDYAQVGGTITGRLSLKNTGTVVIGDINQRTFKLVNAADPGQVLIAGNLDGVPLSLAAGATVSPAPTYTINVPAIDPTIFAVDLVIFVQGKSQAGVSVPRTITKRLDVVRSDLRIKVTSDATSNIVTRGQTIRYTVELQNLSTGTLSNIQLTGETLGAYPGGISSVTVPSLAPRGQAGDKYTLPEFSYQVLPGDNSPLVERITATFGPGGAQTATGQLTLTISDLQIRATLFGECQFRNGTAAELAKTCAEGGEPIISNSIEPPTVVRYRVNVTNVGTTRVTNVRACLGFVVASACTPASATWIPLSVNVLPAFNDVAVGQKGALYADIPTTTYTEIVTVVVTDQTGADVVFRGSKTFSVVSANQYLTMTKTTEQNKTEYFVGETINYQVRACFDGPLSNGTLTNFQARDAFLGLGDAGLITLTVVDSNGVQTQPPGTSVTVNKGDCASGAFPYIAQSKDLGIAEEIDLTNTVVFSFSQAGLPIDRAERSLVLKLKNPLKVSKIITLDGQTEIGKSENIRTGVGITYVYTVENIGPLAINNLVTTDRFLFGDEEVMLFRVSCDVNADGILDDKDPEFPTSLPPAGQPGSIVVRKCTTFAYGGGGPTGSAKGGWQNSLTATGAVSGIIVKGQKIASLLTLVGLTVDKVVDNAFPSVFDPPVTYTVTITNESTEAQGIEYSLLDATDSLSGSLIRFSDNAGNYTIDGDTEGFYADAPGIPVRIKNAVLTWGKSFVVKYKISPRIALEKRSGDGDTINAFTINARVSRVLATVIPAPTQPDAVDEYRVSVNDKATIRVGAPLGVGFCTKGFETYIAWGETPTFVIGLFVDGNQAVPSSIDITKIQMTVSGQTYEIPGVPITLQPGGERLIEFPLPAPIAWNSKVESYDASQVRVDFTQRPVPPATGEPFDWFTVVDLCPGVEGGPPVKLTKTALPTSGDIGSVITYTIKAENKSFHTTVSELVLTDPKIAVGQPIPLKRDAIIVTSLAPGESAAADPIQYTIKETDNIPFVNIAYLNGKRSVDGSPAVVFEPLEARASVSLPTPELEVKLFTYDTSGVPSTSFNANDTVVYVAQIKNNANRVLKLKSATSSDVAYLTGFSPNEGLAAWIASRNGDDTLDPAEQVYINFIPPNPPNPSPNTNGTYRIAAPDGFNQNPPKYTYTSKLNVVYEPIVAPPEVPTERSAPGEATIDLNNPNLQVRLTNRTNGVASYGTVITYDVRVTNPATSGVVITNLQITEEPLFSTATDLWFLNGTGAGIANPTGPLDPGDFYVRTVRHEVLASDFSPLTYKVVAIGNYEIAGNTFEARDERTSTVIISDDQLLASVTVLKDAMTANDANQIDINYTNIGSLPINELTIAVSAEDAAGNTVSSLNYNTTCVLSPQGGDATTKARCTQLPPVSLPDFQLGVLDSTLTTLTFNTPIDAAQFIGLPNPLVIKFTATGVTQDGNPFEPVITRVPIRLIKSANLVISETPNVGAAPISGTVTYAIVVQNLSNTDPINVTAVTDNVTGQVVAMTYPGTPGVIPPGGRATGTTSVVIQQGYANPFLHTTTVTGTQGGSDVTDTSFSQIDILNTAIAVEYGTAQATASTNTEVVFRLRVQNISTKDVTLTATDVPSGTALNLFKDIALTQPLGTDAIKPGEFAYAENRVTTPGAIGFFTSTVEVKATDTDSAEFTVRASARVEVVGVGLIFTQRPAATPAFGAAGTLLNINFTVKNGGTVPAEGIDALDIFCGPTGGGCDKVAGFPTTLAPGAEASGSFTYTIKPTDSGQITFPIIVAGEQVNTATPVVATDIVTFNVAVGSLVLTKTASAATAAPGSNVTYTINLNHISATNNPITNIKITDTLAGVITPTSTTLAPGATASQQYTYAIPATATGTLVNTVIVEFTEGTTNYTATAQASVVIQSSQQSNLVVRVIPSPASGRVGDPIVFSTEVTNTGTSDVSLSAISSLNAAPNINGLLPAGETRVFTSATYTIPTGATGTITNTVTVTGAVSGSTQVVQGIGAGVVTVISPEGLAVVKTANRTTVAPGEVVRYTVQVTNVGPDDMNLRAITDSLVATIPTLPTFPSPLVRDASLTFTYDYTVPANTPAGLLRNTVTVEARKLTPDTSFFASDSVDVTVIPPGTSLVITGTTSAVCYTPGETVRYNVTVYNLSSTPLSGLTATYTIGTGTPGTIALSPTNLPANGQAVGEFAYVTFAGSPDPLVARLNVSNTPTTITATSTVNAVPKCQSAPNLTALFEARPSSFNRVGDKITYSLSLTNSGTSAVTLTSAALNADVNNTNLDPAGFTANPFASLANTLIPAGNTLPPVTFEYTVQAGDLAKTSLIAQVDLNLGATVQAVKANPVTFGTQNSNIIVSLDTFNCPGGLVAGKCFIRPGSRITGAISVTNNSTADLTNIVLTFNTTPVYTVPLTPAQRTVAKGQKVTVPLDWIMTQAIVEGSTPTRFLRASLTSTEVTAPVTSATQAEVEFRNPRITVPSVVLNTGYTSPLPETTKYQFSAQFVNSSTTDTGLTVVNKDTANNSRLRVSLVGTTDNTNKDITSKVTIINPANTNREVVAIQRGQSATVLMEYTAELSDPSPFRIVVSVVACTSDSQECINGVTATNDLNTPVTNTGSSGEFQYQRARIAIAESPNNPRTVQVGQQLALAFTISNPGAVTLVNLDGSLPVTLNGTPIAERLSLGSATSIPPGGSISATLTHTVLASDPKTLSFLIRLTGKSGTAAGADVTASYNTQAVTVGDGNVATNGLAIAMTVDKPTPTNGTAVNFIVTLTNTSAVPIQTIALTSTLPTTLKGNTVTTDVGTAALAGSTVAASIGTLAAGQKATVTINATINATAPATITNQACATSATNTTPICASASVSLAPGGPGGTPETLPVTGIAGGENMLLILMVSALLFLAMTARTRGAAPFLIVGGVVVAIIAVVLILTIIRNAGTRVAVNATNTAIVAPTVIAQRTNVAPPKLGTATDLPPLTAGATLTPMASLTAFPSRTPIASATPKQPLFQPVGDQSLYIPKLALPNAVPIITLPLKNETWDVSTLGQNIGHLEQTSLFGKTGNTVLVAHVQLNFREMGPFLNLKALQPGDKVMAYDRGGFYVYEVTGSKVVLPTNVEVTFPTPEAQLTLITCTQWDANRGAFLERLVVTAKLISTPDSV